MFSSTDHLLMARALRLAERARCWARPNPHVGCVIARGEEVVGEGFTQPAGGAHAEVQALAQAGERAAGASVYVTLEPCSHHGRTPPCVDALLAAGVTRVVAAVADPNPRVNGSGLQALGDAGIAVQRGLLAAEVELQLAGFLQRHRRGRGMLRAKLAMSLDGRTAMASGESQWITGAAARRDVQRLRARSCAIITGIGTVLADDCALTVRASQLADELLLPGEDRRALRVIVDSNLRTPAAARVLAGSQPSLLVHRRDAPVPPAHTGRERLAVAADGAGLDLQALLEHLAARECNEILLECGPSLAGAFLRAGLIDQLLVYIAPKLLGSDARPLFELPLARMAEAVDLRLVDQRRVGGDLRLTFEATAD